MLAAQVSQVGIARVGIFLLASGLARSPGV